jgi:hypothetical protein
MRPAQGHERECHRCHAVVVDEVPWGNGKHQPTNTYMLFLADFAERVR